ERPCERLAIAEAAPAFPRREHRAGRHVRPVALRAAAELPPPKETARGRMSLAAPRDTVERRIRTRERLPSRRGERPAVAATAGLQEPAGGRHADVQRAHAGTFEAAAFSLRVVALTGRPARVDARPHAGAAPVLERVPGDAPVRVDDDEPGVAAAG